MLTVLSDILQKDFIINSWVISPNTEHVSRCKIRDKIFSTINEHGDYVSYKEEVNRWINLETLPSTKRGQAFIGWLPARKELQTGQPKTPKFIGKAALIWFYNDWTRRTQSTRPIRWTLISMTALTTYGEGISASSILYMGFIPGFHTWVNKVFELNMKGKSKGHLLLRQAGLDYHDKYNVFFPASGNYDFHLVGAELGNIYSNKIAPVATHPTSSIPL